MMFRVNARARAFLVALLGLAPLVPSALLFSAHVSGSGAMNMGPDQCALSQVAFCDTFQTIVGGGREGDLDPSKWSFTRVSQQENPSQGQIDNYAPALADFCMDKKMVQPDHDSFICGEQFDESNHWMEAMNDNGQYAMNSARIRQPFDFANRTGNIVFDVDAKTEGPHSFWNEVWITDEPVQGPHIDHPGTHSYPRNGVGFIFNADWCGGALQSANALREIDTFTNYAQTTHAVTSPCFKTASDSANHFQIQISKSHINVFASDPGGANFRQISSNDIPLNFTRGWVHFQHAQYNSEKFNSTSTMTYHWHAIGFDGPTLPPDRGYEVPDSLTPMPDDTVNLGYQVPTKTFSLPNVDTANVAQAYVTYSYWGFNAPAANVVLNGVSTQAPDPTGQGGYQWRYAVAPVPLTALHDGTNTLQIAGKCGDQCPTVANVDLELVLADDAPTDPTMPMPMPMPMPSDSTTTMPPTTTGPVAAVGDVTAVEGNSNSRAMSFRVTLSQQATSQVTVKYTVTSATATVSMKKGIGVDVTANTSGSLVFKLNSSGVTPTTKAITAQMWGNTTPQSNRTFHVTIASVTGGATAGRTVGTGTILDDDNGTSGLTVGVGDATIVEGDSGSRSMVIPVTLSDAASVGVSFAVTSGSATYGKNAEVVNSDFGGKTSGTLAWARNGTRTKNITIPIWPDTRSEGNETFTVTISNPTGGVTIFRATGTGTVIDDDAMR